MLFLDTSAILALAVESPARQVVLDAFDHHEHRCASALALTEALPAIDRLTDDRYDRLDLEDSVRLIWDYLHVVPLDGRCTERAIQLARERPIRLSDALHFASAERLPQPVAFATFDPTQLAVAEDLGFDIISR